VGGEKKMRKSSCKDCLRYIILRKMMDKWCCVCGWVGGCRWVGGCMGVCVCGGCVCMWVLVQFQSRHYTSTARGEEPGTSN